MDKVENTMNTLTFRLRASWLLFGFVFLMACQEVPPAGKSSGGDVLSTVTCADGSGSCTVLSWSDLQQWLNTQLMGYVKSSDLEVPSIYNQLKQECTLQCVSAEDPSCVSGTFPNQTISSSGSCPSHENVCESRCDDFLSSMIGGSEPQIQIPENYHAVKVEIDFCSNPGTNHLVFEGPTFQFKRTRGGLIAPLRTFVPQEVGYGVLCKNQNNGNTRRNAPVRIIPQTGNNVTLPNGKLVYIEPLTGLPAVIEGNLRNPAIHRFGLRSLIDKSDLHDVIWVVNDISQIGGSVKPALKNLESYDNGIMGSAHSTSIHWFQYLAQGKQTISMWAFIPPRAKVQ